MKKKTVGYLLLLLAALLLIVGIKQGGNAAAGGALLAALFGFLSLRLLGAIKHMTKKQKLSNGPQIKDPGVWVADDGAAYHQYDICQYLYGKKSKLIKRSEAVAHGLRPCKKCYPYGD